MVIQVPGARREPREVTTTNGMVRLPRASPRHQQAGNRYVRTFMHAAQSSFGDPAFAQLQRTGIMMDETVDQHAVNPVKKRLRAPTIYWERRVRICHHDLLQQQSTRAGPDTFMKRQASFATSRSLARVRPPKHFLADDAAGRQRYAGHQMRHEVTSSW